MLDPSFGYCPNLAARRLIREIRREPALDGLGGLALALRVARDLVLADAADGEIARMAAREIQAAHAGGWRHRRVLGEIDAGRARVQQLEQLEFLAVIRTRRIPDRRADAAVLLRNDVRRRRRGLVDPPLAARAPMQIGGAGFRQAIGNRLDEDRAVIVMLLFESARQRVGADPRGDGERAEEIA